MPEHESFLQFQQIEPGTYIPLDDREVGLPHHYFSEVALRNLFRQYTIIDLHLDSDDHYCLIAVRH